jgi:hypothetical protein
MTRLQFLTRPVAIGHALIGLFVAVATGTVAVYGLQVRQTDQLVRQCYANNGKWIPTAVKDIRDARREFDLAKAPREPELRAHLESAQAALFAARRILALASRPIAPIQSTGEGPVFAYWPSKTARLRYCEDRYPRPWPL